MRDLDVDAIGTDELLDLAERQMRAWTDAAVALLPPDPARVDMHCHLGVDIDGSTITTEQLLAQLDGAGVYHACVTPLAQPDGYVAANEQVRGWAEASGGRLHALHRCDSRSSDCGGDARRGLEAGAVGLKWHPRAEQFSMRDDLPRTTAAIAHDAGVPILIHAGRGMERLGEGVVELAREFPNATFVLAHAAISDLSWIVDATHDVPNVVFDTSWWRPIDVAVLFTSCEPERVLFGTDPPYGTVRLGLQITARLARACGWRDDAMSALMGGTARPMFGIEAGDDRAPTISGHAPHLPEEVPAFRRAGELLSSAMQVTFAGGDPAEVFDLATAALDVLDSHEHASTARLLHGAINVGVALLGRDRSDELFTASRIRFAATELLIATLVHLATPALPMPGIDRVGWSDPAPFV